MPMKQDEIVKGIVILIVGIFILKWAYERPCDIGDLTQTVMGQQVTIQQPEALERILCLSTDLVGIIASIISTSAIWIGANRLWSNI